jgi:hypothetical protein
VDLGSTARQPATESAPGGEESEATAATPASTKTRSNIFPASAGTAPAPIDPALLIKGGAAVLAIILVLVVIFSVRACSGDSAKPVAETKANSQPTLLLTATGPVEVQVREDTADGPIIWRGQLEANDSHSLPKRGKLFLTATAMENLQIEINGKRAPNPHSGKLTVQIP